MQIFLTETPKQLASLAHAVETGDLEKIENTAHTLKSELGYLGLPAAAQKAGDLERMGHNRTLQLAPDLFLAFRAEILAISEGHARRPGRDTSSSLIVLGCFSPSLPLLRVRSATGAVQELDGIPRRGH